MLATLAALQLVVLTQLAPPREVTPADATPEEVAPMGSVRAPAEIVAPAPETSPAPPAPPAVAPASGIYAAPPAAPPAPAVSTATEAAVYAATPQAAPVEPPAVPTPSSPYAPENPPLPSKPSSAAQPAQGAAPPAAWAQPTPGAEMPAPTADRQEPVPLPRPTGAVPAEPRPPTAAPTLPPPPGTSPPPVAPPASRPRRLSLLSGEPLRGGSTALAWGGWSSLGVAYGQGLSEVDDLGGYLDYDWAKSEFVVGLAYRRSVGKAGGWDMAGRLSAGWYSNFGSTLLEDENRSDRGMEITPGLSVSRSGEAGVFSAVVEGPITITWKYGAGLLFSPRLTLSFETPVYQDVTVGFRAGAAYRAGAGEAPLKVGAPEFVFLVLAGYHLL